MTATMARAERLGSDGKSALQTGARGIAPPRGRTVASGRAAVRSAAGTRAGGESCELERRARSSHRFLFEPAQLVVRRHISAHRVEAGYDLRRKLLQFHQPLAREHGIARLQRAE